jgi:hypothetical protein
VKTIPGYCEKRSPSRRNHCSPSARNLVRLHSGTLFTFTPESRSPSPGIRTLNQIADRHTEVQELQQTTVVMRAQAYRRNLFSELDRVKDLLLL